MTPSISGFTFLRNGVELGFPFEESIRSLLPLVDEFVIAVDKGNDSTWERLQALGDAKIRLIETRWNERMSHRGFVYAQQKMIAQYACTGDWAFYLEGDEVLHEAELDNIRQSLLRRRGIGVECNHNPAQPVFDPHGGQGDLVFTKRLVRGHGGRTA